MDISRQAEITLREEGYETWPWTGATPPVTCFENAAVIGFVHVFSSREELLAGWKSSQQAVLYRYAAALRGAGAKAWNVYSVFLTAAESTSQQRVIAQIEEDFTLTRKIVRAGVRTPADLEHALLPLSSVKAQPVLGEADFEVRLRARLREIPPEALTAFFGEARPDDVARILGAET